MDQSQEYHDPDYPETSEPPKGIVQELSEEEKLQKIRNIINREFTNELENRQNDVMLLEQRMLTSRRLLHRLRYVLVNEFYRDKKLQITNSQIDDDINGQQEARVRAELSHLLRDGQRALPPSVRKLLGKESVDFDEIFMPRPLRKKPRKDYSAMIQSKNYTIPAGTTKSLRPETNTTIEVIKPEPGPSKPKKVPRHLEPKCDDKVVTLDDPTRNKMKHRYRLIIGNTSKYAPASSAADRSTHKWLVYVRGAPPRPDASRVLRAVVARLHASYAPHHTVHVYKAPFHISRRGWGEFPARIELHFPLPEINRPATVEHTIKLDRNYTGLQTLGAETIVDVWLYSTPEMLEFEYVDPIPAQITEANGEDTTQTDQQEIQTKMEINKDEEGTQTIKTEPDIQTIVPKVEPDICNGTENEHTDSWMEFFSKDTSELNVDEMIILPNKKTIGEVVENITDEVVVKKEPTIDENEQEWSTEVKTENQQMPEEIINQPKSVKKRIMKYIDSTTGKIYYLEMDRNLDLSKVQEIIFNNSQTAKISPIKSNGLKNVRKKKTGGFSLLKPEVKNQLKNDICKDKLVQQRLADIENDHCYLGIKREVNIEHAVDEDSVTSDENDKSVLSDLCESVCKLASVRSAVNYLLKKMPVVTDLANNTDYVKCFPFVVRSQERYWKLDFAKRRNIEWTRAKMINRILSENFKYSDPVWKTKQILIYSRLHGYHPIRSDCIKSTSVSEEWSSWNNLEGQRQSECNIKTIYPYADHISSLTLFDTKEYLNTSYTESEVISDNEEEIDVLCCSDEVKVHKEVLQDSVKSVVIPVESDEERLRFMFIERKCADIGIELRNEDMGNGCSYSAVHAVILSAVKSFAEDLIRSSLAETLTESLPEDTLPPVWTTGVRSPEVSLSGVYAATSQDWLSSKGMATTERETQAL